MGGRGSYVIFSGNKIVKEGVFDKDRYRFWTTSDDKAVVCLFDFELPVHGQYKSNLVMRVRVDEKFDDLKPYEEQAMCKIVAIYKK